MPFISHNNEQVVPVWINGKAAATDESRLIKVNSAWQAKTIHLAQGASEETARAAADAAWMAFRSWRETKYTVRRDLLLRVADLYEQKVEEIARIQVEETSCSDVYARFNVKLACSIVRDFAGSIVEALTGETPPIQAEGVAMVLKEPVGPVLLIPPWNSAMILSTRGVAGAIAAGCTVVMKASEACPRTHNMIVDIFEEAGLPKGCINQVQAERKDAAAVTETLIAHKAIRKVEFIGSAGIGSKIGQTAAKYLKPILMELGGKGPAIVLEDADLKKAAELCAFGAFVHHGQICFSTERIIVEKAVAEQFTKHLQDEIAEHYTAASGRAVDKAGAAHAHDLMQAALQNGATLIAGNASFLDESQLSLKPSILTNIKPTHDIYDQETFGPSASLYVVANEREALDLANSSAYGLSATIHTKDYMKALSMARKLEYGQVHINTTTVYDQSTLPVSGVKGSGWGNNNGKYGLREFLEDKTVTLHTTDEALAFGS